MRARLVLLIAIVALAAPPLFAQQAGARLAGVVHADEPGGAPIRGAVVTISAPELTRPRSTITDVSGAFAFTALPAGRYAIVAVKPPYLQMAFGATRAGRQGTSIRLAANEARGDLALRLPRGAVVAGTLRDLQGAPLEGVTVSLTPANAPPQTNLQPQLPSATTDDRGAYRVYGLMPGAYYVAATFTTVGTGELRMGTAADLDRRFAELERRAAALPAPGSTMPAAAPAPLAPATPRQPGYSLAPTFYPGTTNPAEATLVTVASGEERVADFTVGPVRSGTVEGTIVTADGSPIPGPAGSSGGTPILISLDLGGPQLPFSFGGGPMLAIRPTATDSRFKFGGVGPGRYYLSATMPSRSGTALIGVAEVQATGDDIVGLTLVLDAGQRLSGTVKFDGAIAAPKDLTRTRLSMVSNRPGIGLSGLGINRPQTNFAALTADGTFTFTGLAPATYTVAPMTLPGGWVLQSAIINGKDALDVPFDTVTGGDVTGAIFTFTDRHTELSGALRAGDNSPATDFFVIAFPTDPALWKSARRLQSTRPASDGVFALRDLPAGEYFVAALTDVVADDLKDANFLSAVVPGAIKVAIGDGEKKTQDLKIGR